MSPSPVVYKNRMHEEEMLRSFDPVFGLTEFFRVPYLSQYPSVLFIFYSSIVEHLLKIH